jgi:hypothetical protein
MFVRAMKFRGLKKFWSIVAALLMAAQIGLAFHAVDHQFTSDASVEHCVLCKVSQTMAAAPSAPAIAPIEYAIGHADHVVVTFSFSSPPTAAFRSRAPPIVSA